MIPAVVCGSQLNMSDEESAHVQLTSAFNSNFQLVTFDLLLFVVVCCVVNLAK